MSFFVNFLYIFANSVDKITLLIINNIIGVGANEKKMDIHSPINNCVSSLRL